MKSIEVVAAIILSGGKVFATQRGYGKYKDFWEFPGGKMEAGETREEALKREIREELDSEIEIDRLFSTVEYDYPEFHLRMHCFLVHLTAGHLALKEHEAARWLDESDIYEVDWLPADYSLLKDLKTILKRNGK